tara:strand:- start:43379 stop:44269 length:891 start_codon:yes stop_codon:yes gene_type:complete
MTTTKATAALLLTATVISTIPTEANAGIRRHDRADELYLNLGAESQFSSVARLQIGTSICSATLISPEWMITAAHCFDGTNNPFTLAFPDSGGFNIADQVIIHPDWTPGQYTAGGDLALIHLSTPITELNSAMLYQGSNDLGALGYGVGFGRSGTGNSGEIPGTQGYKRAGTNMIDVLGSARGFDESILLMDFDNPLRESDSTYGSAIPTDLEYQVAPGDSGGALFVEENGQFYLAGVTSFINSIDGNPDGDYGDMSAYTRLSDYNAWINSVIPAPSGLLVLSAGMLTAIRRRRVL